MKRGVCQAATAGASDSSRTPPIHQARLGSHGPQPIRWYIQLSMVCAEDVVGGDRVGLRCRPGRCGRVQMTSANTTTRKISEASWWA